jgi:peptidyl-prolyl cis-trans isomerase C
VTTLLDFTNTVLPKGKVKVPEPPRPAHVPISVNGVEIGAEAVRAEAQHHPAETSAKAFAEAARALVVRELLLQEAVAKGVVASPETFGEGRRETDEDAAIRALLDQEVTTPKADHDACRRYFAANPQKFRSATLYEARHILFAAPVSDEAARARAKADAEAAIAALMDDLSLFPSLALAHSACPSRAQGGSLGQLSKGSTVPEFETVLFALEAGQLSPVPAPTPFGYHVIVLDRIIAGRQLPFNMVRDRIAAWLEAASWSRAVSQYVGILAGRAVIDGITLAAADGPLVQ